MARVRAPKLATKTSDGIRRPQRESQMSQKEHRKNMAKSIPNTGLKRNSNFHPKVAFCLIRVKPHNVLFPMFPVVVFIRIAWGKVWCEGRRRRMQPGQPKIGPKRTSEGPKDTVGDA